MPENSTNQPAAVYPAQDKNLKEPDNFSLQRVITITLIILTIVYFLFLYILGGSEIILFILFLIFHFYIFFKSKNNLVRILLYLVALSITSFLFGFSIAFCFDSCLINHFPESITYYTPLLLYLGAFTWSIYKNFALRILMLAPILIAYIWSLSVGFMKLNGQ
ncbi:MAG: hypothetical protein AAB531_05085 [Patescibacteria group bacterium]